MSFEPLCPYYDHSRCLLHRRFCDLDCGHFYPGKRLGEEGTNRIHKWSHDEWEEELRRKRGVMPPKGYEY